MEAKSGGSKGKEDFLCKYCNSKIRKDTLKRHTDNKHKGMEPKYKHIAAGVIKLDTLGFSTKKVEKRSDGENNPSLSEVFNPVEIESDEEEDLIDKSGDYNLEDPDINDNFGDIETVTIQSKKKRPNDVCDIPLSDKITREDDLDGIEMKLNAFGQQLLAHFDTKIEKVVGKLSKDKLESERKLRKRNPDELIEHTDEEINNLINTRKSIDSLEDAFELQDIGILKEADIKPGIDGYFCRPARQAST